MAEFCPLIKGKCKQHQCMMFKSVRGTNPMTGQDIDQFDCAISLIPMAIIETAKEMRQGAAATESFRNVVHSLATGQPVTIKEQPQPLLPK